MKKARSAAKPAPKDSDATQAIGGQPENDRDARDAGLSSATPGNGKAQAGRGARRSGRAPAKAGR